MKRFLIAGNWKMHTTLEDARALAQAIADHVERAPNVDVLLAPPFPWLLPVHDVIAQTRIALGAQNMHWEPQGAFTGEVSPQMLLSAGCTHVIIGHSERRQYFGETDETVFRKIGAAMHAGLRPILCVGETLNEREAGLTFKVVRRQLWGALEGLQTPAELIIAYEPVWAIGTGVPAHPEQAQEVHAFIRQEVPRIWDRHVDIRILYGGSVKPDNIEGFLRQPDVDGALVGGASLHADAFNAMIDIAQRLSESL